MKLLLLTNVKSKNYNIEQFKSWLDERIAGIDCIISLGNVDKEFFGIINDRLFKNENIVRLGIHAGNDCELLLEKYGFWDLHLKPFTHKNIKFLGYEGVKAKPGEAFFAYTDEQVDDFFDITIKAEVLVTHSPTYMSDPKKGFKTFDLYIRTNNPLFHIFSWQNDTDFTIKGTKCIGVNGIKLIELKHI